MEAQAFVFIPTSKNKGTEVVLDIHPLVLCKNCEWWDKGYTEECRNSDSVCFSNGRCEPDFFCADGEERSETK